MVSVDPAPVIAVDPVKPKAEKTEEGLSGKDIEVIEDALEKLGKTFWQSSTFASSSSWHIHISSSMDIKHLKKIFLKDCFDLLFTSEISTSYIIP